MKKILLSLLVSLIFSCGDTPSQTPMTPHFQTEKCISDGATIFLRCDDGREKAIDLGFGQFKILEFGKASEGFNFCNSVPSDITINIKNAHLIYKELRMSGLRIKKDKIYNSECQEARKAVNCNFSEKLVLEVERLPAQ